MHIKVIPSKIVGFECFDTPHEKQAVLLEGVAKEDIKPGDLILAKSSTEIRKFPPFFLSDKKERKE